MELNDDNMNSPVYFDNYSVLKKEGVKKYSCSDYFFNPLEVIHSARNFILILSYDGRPKKISRSLYEALGYSDDELLYYSHANEFLISGEFALDNSATSYYFDTVIECKGGINKKITWRFLPNLLINEFVYIGWEL